MPAGRRASARTTHAIRSTESSVPAHASTQRGASSSVIDATRRAGASHGTETSRALVIRASSAGSRSGAIGVRPLRASFTSTVHSWSLSVRNNARAARASGRPESRSAQSTRFLTVAAIARASASGDACVEPWSASTVPLYPATMIRILEPEVMDTVEDALEYEAMDHSQANESFVERLLHLGVSSGHALDIGTGPGHIPVLAAER